MFITASREHAVDAFSLGALHYLVKPVTGAGVTGALRRRETHAGAHRSITLTVNRELHRVYLDNVVSIQSARHLVEVKLTDGRCFRVWQPVSEIEQLLDADFLKINRGIIVNMNQITCMDLETCSLSDGSVLPVKQRDRAVILKQYNDFLFHQLHLMAAAKRGSSVDPRRLGPFPLSGPCRHGPQGHDTNFRLLYAPYRRSLRCGSRRPRP